MKLHQLPKITTSKKSRRGRGYGSGRGGHTTGTGQKGQKTRSKISLIFEGGQLPLTKRLPWLRGKKRFQSLSPATITINLNQLNQFSAKTVITRDRLVESGLVSAKEAVTSQIKITNKGKLSKAITVKDLPTTSSAQKSIEKAGGKISLS